MRAAESGYGLARHVAEHYFGSIYYTVALHNYHVEFVMMLHMRRGFCTLVLSSSRRCHALISNLAINAHNK